MTCRAALLNYGHRITFSQLDDLGMLTPCVSSTAVQHQRGGPRATKWPSPAILPLRVCFLLRLFIVPLFCYFFFFLFFGRLPSAFLVCVSPASTLLGRRQVDARACSVFMDLREKIIPRCFDHIFGHASS